MPFTIPSPLPLPSHNHKVWQGFYLKPTSGVYTFLLSLTEQARRVPKNLPLVELQRSLNRLILYQVSTIPSTDAEQKSLMDTLCLYSSQAHDIFRYELCYTYCTYGYGDFV